MELDQLIEYWGNKQLTPMLLVDDNNQITWRNPWADWLFRIDLGINHLRQLPAGDVLAGYADEVRKYNAPPILTVNINDLNLDIEGRMTVDHSPRMVILKFHTRYLSRASMMEMHKFMQDFALEAGDRVNNPLTTVINCLHMIEREVKEGRTEKIQTYLELAIREAFVMKSFGDWVRRLSEESPSREAFALIPVLEEVLVRRGCEGCLEVDEEIPPVRGNAEHVGLIFGGLVNLIRQATGKGVFSLRTSVRGSLVTVEINTAQARVKNLRMLSEEFYGGLGLLAARYLLSLMQAQLEMEFNGDVGIRVTFVTAKSEVERSCRPDLLWQFPGGPKS